MKKVRDNQFDNIKAILIFCVLLGHVISNFGRTGSAAVVYDIIFSFHMPAFLFVSGYFAKYNPKKVFASLCPLYVIFQVLQYLEQGILEFFETGDLKMGRFDLFTPQWTLWYLLALMAFQLLLPVFDTDNKKKQGGFLLLALALGMMVGFAPDTDNFLAMSRVFVFLPFYLWGYYEKKNQMLRTLRNSGHPFCIRGVAAAVGVALVLLFCLFQSRIVSKNFYGTEPFDNAGMFVGRVFFWMTAALWILILVIWVPDRKLGYLGTIGRNTLPVYLFHSLVILALAATPLKGVMEEKLFLMICLSAVLTVILAWNRLEMLLRNIRIPCKS